MSDDLTVVFYTANYEREPFFSNVVNYLRESAKNYPIISVSQKPMDLGRNILFEGGRSYLNIYRQMLIGAKAAETKYVAFTEDDLLFPPEHFNSFRPKDDEFGYDMHKWGLFTWRQAIYVQNFRQTTGMICPRGLFIDAMEERFAKHPVDEEVPLKFWGEVGRYEKPLGVTVRKATGWFSPVAHIVFFHEDSFGFEYLGTAKRMGAVRAYDIPYWGKAIDVMRRFYGTQN